VRGGRSVFVPDCQAPGGQSSNRSTLPTGLPSRAGACVRTKRTNVLVSTRDGPVRVRATPSAGRKSASERLEPVPQLSGEGDEFARGVVKGDDLCEPVGAGQTIVDDAAKLGQA
jgi:hypothetical protein